MATNKKCLSAQPKVYIGLLNAQELLCQNVNENLSCTTTYYVLQTTIVFLLESIALIQNATQNKDIDVLLNTYIKRTARVTDQVHTSVTINK